MDKHSNKSKINKEVEKSMEIINKQMEYLASLCIDELKDLYSQYKVSWLYIAEMKQQGYITEKEMNFITSYWK